MNKFDWEKEWDIRFSKSLQRTLAWQGGITLLTENQEAKSFIKRLLQSEYEKNKKLNSENNALRTKIENIKRICYIK